MFVSVLTLAAIVAVLVWVAWDHARYAAAPSESVRFVRSHRRGWFQ
jgi:hypothetical protein